MPQNGRWTSFAICYHFCYHPSMATVLIRNIDEEVHRAWKAEAKRRGIALNAILKECLEKAALAFENPK